MSSVKWVQLLQSSLNTSMKENRDSISYALASHAGGHPSVRFVVHRGFVGQVNHDETLSSTCMLVTTDVRAPKAAQISSSSPVSLAWWLLPTKTQFRIVSNAYIFPPPGHALHSIFPADRLAPSSPSHKTGSSAFDWEAERIRIFDTKMSPDLRASFVRPVPGSPLQEGQDETWPETLPSSADANATEQQKAWIKQALSNFALIVMEPTSVDICELGVVPNKRTSFVLDKTSNSWLETSLVP